MSKYRKQLPQLSGGLFLTDGGIETTLIFHEGLELPHFAAFHLLREKAGREALARYYERYMTIAKADGVGFILESPTWRASTDWGDKLGYTREEIAAANRESIRLMLDLRAKHDATSEPIVVSGCVGPRGDGYDPGQVMSAAEAEDLPYAPDRRARGGGCGHGDGDHHDQCQRGRRRGKGGREGRKFPSPSRSRSRPMAVCRPAKRCRTRSARSTLQRRPHPPTT